MQQRGGDGRTRDVPAWVRDAGSVVVAIVIGGLATDAADATAGVSAGLEVSVGSAAAVTLWWRRRAPLVVAAVTFVAAVVAPFAAGAAIVSVYTVAVHRPTRIASVVAALYLAPGALALLVRPERQLDGEALLGAVLFTGGALGWGIAVRVRHEAADERAAHREREHQARVAEARQSERRRIASEMHDVLGHRLSLLSLHAGAIELRPGMRPEDLAASASLVRRNAHLALDDLRAVIGVLHDEAATALAPSPTASDIETLLAECREAGMHIEAHTTSVALDAVPDDLGRHVHRIVQEGLTNARKHAPGRTVELHLTGAPGRQLRVEVTNATAQDPAVGDGAGVGLVGLRERVTSAGGTLDHDVDEAGIHRLCAHLPWPA